MAVNEACLARPRPMITCYFYRENARFFMRHRKGEKKREREIKVKIRGKVSSGRKRGRERGIERTSGTTCSVIGPRWRVCPRASLLLGARAINWCGPPVVHLALLHCCMTYASPGPSTAPVWQLISWEDERRGEGGVGVASCDKAEDKLICQRSSLPIVSSIIIIIGGQTSRSLGLPTRRHRDRVAIGEIGRARTARE